MLFDVSPFLVCIIIGKISYMYKLMRHNSNDVSERHTGGEITPVTLPV